MASFRADSELMLLMRLMPASYKLASGEKRDATNAVAVSEWRKSLSKSLAPKSLIRSKI